ncbi:MAG: methyltransferase domain-containing protein [Firmicutes bacterium]|nr:methyltransferase domain-containing protein [Bacillota bacterium]
MNDLAAERIVYDTLKSVFSSGAYSTQALHRALKNAAPAHRPYITKLFYGVLDKSIQFDYMIAALTQKKPQNAVALLLKIGLYLLRYTDTPEFAAVHKTVQLAKLTGKRGAEGFINAALKNSVAVSLPSADTPQGLSVVASYPEWIVKRLIEDYGFTFTRDFLLYQLPVSTHIRVNQNRISAEEFAQKYPLALQNPSEYGYYVTHNMQSALEKSDYTVQSLASMKAVRRYTQDFSPKHVLDLCAAPGGKSVYLKQLFPSAHITACDIHAHRVQLIRQYAAAAGAEITVLQNDALIHNPDFTDRFDLVVCDAPCSGIGVAGKKPEILWNKNEHDITQLAKLQFDMLIKAADYVCGGGRLCYSTCTVFKEENDRVAQRFLSARPDFTLHGEAARFFPHTDGCDGFFVAVFVKTC